MKLNNNQFLAVFGTILLIMFGVVCYDRYMLCYNKGGWYCVFGSALR